MPTTIPEPRAVRLDRDMRGEVAPPGVDRAIAGFVARQHGVISRPQLRELGLSDDAIDRRVTFGRLHVVHRGVYAVGHTVLAQRGRWMAAVLAGGRGAVLSHASAAALWELRGSAAKYIDVSVRRSGRTRRPGLRLHWPRTLTMNEITTKEGIPTTTPARTILDLAATLQQHRLERLLDQAEILQLTDYPSLDAIARAHPGHRGATKLRSTLAKYEAGATLKRSDLERLFLKICDDHDLPTPAVNHSPAGEEVDFLFAEHRLIVEADSWRFHKTRQAFERDRRRDATHLRLGYRTLRVTDRQLEHSPNGVAHTIAAALTA
jgi:hypothetical protein